MIIAAELAHVHSILLTIVEKELGISPPIPETITRFLESPNTAVASQPVSEEMNAWLDLLDAAISPQRLRNYGQRQRLEEPAILALLRFWVAKQPHSSADRDKVAWLATYLFRMREEEGNQPTGWAKSELQNILKGIAFPPPNPDVQTVLEEFPALVQDITDLQNLSQLADSRLLERGRSLKKQVGEEYFHPTVLAAIVNYNLVLGKKFDELLQQALEQAHNLLSSQQSRETFHEEELIWDDYHSTTDALHQLSELSRTKPPEKEEKDKPLAAQDTVLEQQLVRLGIDSAREASKLRSRLKEMANHLRTNPAITSVRISGTPLQLEDWEAHSFRTLSQQREQNLRAEFARTITRAIAIVLRIYEEQYAYQSKKSLGGQWQKHANSLFYLLCEGLRHKGILLELSFVARKSGEPEMAQQFALTAEKLESNLAKVSELF